MAICNSKWQPTLIRQKRVVVQQLKLDDDDDDDDDDKPVSRVD